MKRSQKVMASFSIITILAVGIMVGSGMYSTHKTIMNASDQCYDRGGLPEVERDLLGVNFSFSCEM
ncbi:hypothetical protein U0355_09700 [Salimicrobium sp. PL1-032A]|uniref:hypothetical protein n=1 Tax=Salimicrobium sp. PL1-032A TaxID=3095364 RepID=UPI003261A1F9